MKLPKVHPSTESKARQEYENLVELCTTSSGLDRLLINSDDPKTVAITTRTRKLFDDLKKYEEGVKNGPVTVNLRRLIGRSGDVKKIRLISEDIRGVHELLLKTTKIRGDYKLLSSVALFPSLDAIEGLTTAHTFAGTWIMEFEHTDGWLSGIRPSGRDTANTMVSVIAMLMKELKLTYRSVHEWWRASHLDKNKRETLVWNDLRVMARRVVFLLDDLEDDTLKTIGTFCECVVMANRIARSIILFADAHFDRVEVVRPCLELLAPILYILSLSKNDLLTQSNSESLQVLVVLFRQLASFVEACSNSQSAESTNSNQSKEQRGTQGIHSELERDASAAGPVNEGAKQGNNGNRIFHSADQLKRFRLDKIELEETPRASLGAGSFSVVNMYKARSGDTEYAVKSFSRIEDDFDDERIWNHVFREARIWSDVDCENINKLVGYCTLPNVPYPSLVMEVCNWNLQNYCTTHKVGADSRLNFMLDVATGLNYLHTHEARYAHGDLRTENILIKVTNTKPRPFAVITDFGVSDMAQIDFNRVAYNTASQAAPKQYLAPEFWKDLPEGTVKVSEKADMYAFGCVFAIVICKVTELYKNAGEKLRKMKEKGEPPVAREQLPNVYRQFLYKLWNKTPEGRPSASEAISAINEFIVCVRSKSNYI